jgi:hypothetical protein
LNGFEDTILVLDQAPRYAQKAAVYTLDLNQDLTKEIQSLQSQYPSAQFSYLKNIGMLTAGAPDLATFLQVRKSVGALAGISSSSISFESYKMPFSLGKPVDLGQADQSTVIDLEQIRTESKNLKSHGVQFYTQTSLPKPFGYGPFAGYSIQNLLITVTATDPNEVEKIASRLAPYGIKVESVLKSSGIIIGSYINSDETPLESLKKNEKSISSVEFTSNSGSSSKAEQSKRK